MVVRYGAISESDGEIDIDEHENEDNVSENSFISLCNYKRISLGETQ